MYSGHNWILLEGPHPIHTCVRACQWHNNDFCDLYKLGNVHNNMEIVILEIAISEMYTIETIGGGHCVLSIWTFLSINFDFSQYQFTT